MENVSSSTMQILIVIKKMYDFILVKGFPPHGTLLIYTKENTYCSQLAATLHCRIIEEAWCGQSGWANKCNYLKPNHKGAQLRRRTHSPTPTPSLTNTVQCCSQHALQKECWQGSASRESLRTTCRQTPHWRGCGACETQTQPSRMKTRLSHRRDI